MTALWTHASWRVAALLLVVLSSVIAPDLWSLCRAEPLPEGAFARLGEFRKFDGRDLTYSPDGKYVAAVYLGRVTRLYDARTGAPVRVLVGHKGEVRAHAFSPDGRCLASAGRDKDLCLWNVADGELLRRIDLTERRQFPWISTVVFSRDSQHVLLAGNQESLDIRMFDVATGNLVRTFDPPGTRTTQLVVSPDGKLLLAMGRPMSGGPRKVWLKELEGGKTRFELEGPITRWVFSPDGKTLAYARYERTQTETGTRKKREIRLLDPTDGTVRQTIEGSSRFAFSPDSRLLAYVSANESDRQHILVRELESGKIVRRLHSHDDTYGNIQLLFSPDGMTLLIKEHWQAREYDVQTGVVRAVPRAHEDRIFALEWSRDGKQLLTASDEFVAYWDIASRTIVHQLQEDGRLVGAKNIAMSPSRRLLATSKNNPVDLTAEIPIGTATTWIWETESGKPRLQFTTRGAQSTAFSPDEKLLAVGAEIENTHILDVQTGKELRQLTTKPLGQSVRFLPDGRLAVGSDKDVHLWDVTTGEMVTRLEGPRGHFVKLLCPVPSNLGLIGETGGRLIFWDLTTKQSWTVFTNYYRGMDKMALSADGRVLAVTGAHRDPNVADAATTRQHQTPCIRLFDVATGAILHQHMRPGHDFGVLAFSPDRRVLAAATANTVLLFDVAPWTGADNPEPQPMSAAQLAVAWTRLSSANAREAYAAMAQLRAAGHTSVEFISEHLHPLEDNKPAPRVLAELFQQLDHGAFDTRKRAAEKLKQIGPSILPELEELSRESPSAEVRLRARATVREFRLRNGFVIESAKELRAYRAVQVLEQIGTAEADRLLRQLAEGAPGRQTIETKLAVERRSRDLP